MSLASFSVLDRLSLENMCAQYVADAAETYGATMGQIYGRRGTRHSPSKTGPVVAARESCILKLRALRMAFGIHGCHLVADGQGQPLSTPVIAELLRLKNHTTVVLALKRMNERCVTAS